MEGRRQRMSRLPVVLQELSVEQAAAGNSAAVRSSAEAVPADKSAAGILRSAAVRKIRFEKPDCLISFQEAEVCQL